MSGEPSPAVVYVNLLPVVEACVVVAVPGRVGEVRVAADDSEPEAVDLDPGVLARRLEPRVFKRKRVSPPHISFLKVRVARTVGIVTLSRYLPRSRYP